MHKILSLPLPLLHRQVMTRLSTPEIMQIDSPRVAEWIESVRSDVSFGLSHTPVPMPDYELTRERGYGALFSYINEAFKIGDSSHEYASLPSPYAHDGRLKLIVENIGLSSRQITKLQPYLVATFPTPANVEVFWTGIRGYGVRSITALSAGSFVCEYAGIIKDKGDNEYTYVIHEKSDVWEQTTSIDASKYGNVARFINHSCPPRDNLVPIITHKKHVWPSIGLFARYDIDAGDELLFCYNGDGSMPCLCGTSECNGYF